jgi:hypothetical protein
MMMEDYLSFRKMITPVIIQVIFWIGAVAVAIYALWQIFTGATASYEGGALVLRGLVTLVLGPFIWRIYCEVMIVLFRINETLTEIKKKVGKK